MGYNAKVHGNGPDVLEVEPGGKLRIKSGGLLEVNGANVPAQISLAAAAGGANVCEVTITVKDNAGSALAAVWNLDVWLSDDADGEGLTATSASGAVQAKAASGTDLSALVAKKALRVQTKKTGVYVLSITDTAKTAFKVCAQLAAVRATPLVLAGGNYG